MPVEQGNHVKVEYTGTFDDGTVFDSSAEHEGEPLGFDVGASQVVPGFEQAMIGMEEGEEKEFHLDPADAYGERDERLIKPIPRDQFPPGDIQEGMMIMLGTPQGERFPATIAQISDEEITLDLNHPLAGKALNFKVKLLEISEGHGDSCGCDECASCNDGECAEDDCCDDDDDDLANEPPAENEEPIDE